MLNIDLSCVTSIRELLLPVLLQIITLKNSFTQPWKLVQFQSTVQGPLNGSKQTPLSWYTWWQIAMKWYQAHCSWHELQVEIAKFSKKSIPPSCELKASTYSWPWQHLWSLSDTISTWTWSNKWALYLLRPSMLFSNDTKKKQIPVTPSIYS